MRAELRRATPADLPVAERLLAEDGLPVDDLDAGHLAFVAEVDGVPSAVIGLEQYADQGLLRSLVVAGTARGTGLGRKLVAALEAFAAARGVTELWLLTIDADAFFAKLGYSERSRHEAPATIRGTAEFSSLCPASAVLMSKSLH